MKLKIQKIVGIFLSLSLMFVSFTLFSSNVQGKTLGDLKAELNKKIEEYNKNESQKELTNEEIERINFRIHELQLNIESNQKEIIRLEDEIKELNNQIERKEQEIKDVVKFHQISSGTSTYFEYIFGATGFTDLIYRIAVSEQLLDYNDKLIDDYNSLVAENQNKQKDLSEQEIKMNKEQNDLEVQLNKLGDRLGTLTDKMVDIEDEIAAQKEAIRIYEEEYKCKDNDEISECTTSKLPADTSFWRPIKTGYRTSEYGYRTLTLNGNNASGFHSGIDLSTSVKENVPIYASAAGVVISVLKRTSCGGNQIFLHHKINGKTYTTSYAHLREVLVEVGDVVTKDTQIAVMGGDPKKEYWDKCSSGTHVHFSISTGLYLKDYSSWNSYLAHTLNPRTIVNFPAGGGTFTDRITKY